MKIKHLVVVWGVLTAIPGLCPAQDHTGSELDTLHYPGEARLANVTQLTFGGDNAEAYFSFDDSMIVFQATNPAWDAECDQIYCYEFGKGDMRQSKPLMVSTGKGRTTCSYFMPGNREVLYATTQFGDSLCPEPPARRPDHKYVWPVYPSFEIVRADLQGNITGRLASSPGYDAEATVSPKGDKIVFTSMRSGDLELYTMNIDGSDIRQITDQLGYDGGAFFSPDGSQIVFRASRPATPEEVREYQSLLAQDLVMPTAMEIYVCQADGSGLRQVTRLGGANWAPFFTPDGKQIIFSSNHKTRGFNFNLYVINVDGSGLEQITFDPKFDAFPMFSFDGKKLIWSSNRNNKETRDTNLFIADWVE